MVGDFDVFFFFSSRRRHTRFSRDWSSDVCSSDLQQQQGGERFREARTSEDVTAQPGAGVGNLVVVLEKGHKCRWRQVKRRGAAALRLPLVVLPLVKIAVLQGRDKLLRRAQVVGVICLVASG